MAVILKNISEVFDKKPVMIDIIANCQDRQSGNESNTESLRDNYKSATRPLAEVLDPVTPQSEVRDNTTPEMKLACRSISAQSHDAIQADNVDDPTSSPTDDTPKPSTEDVDTHEPTIVVQSLNHHKIQHLLSPPRIPSMQHARFSSSASHPRAAVIPHDSPRHQSRDGRAAIIATRLRYVSRIAASILIGLDFALFPSIVPQISDNMRSWFWSPLYGVSYLFAAMLSTMLWPSGKPERLIGFAVAYVIFSTGTVMTIVQYGISMRNGSVFIIWRAMAGFGSMRLINQPCQSTENWVESVKFISLGLGAVLGTLLSSSAEYGVPSPPILFGLFAGIFVSLSTLWSFGLYFWSRIRKADLERSPTRREEKYVQIPSTDAPLDSDICDAVPARHFPGVYLFHYYCSYPLIAMEISLTRDLDLLERIRPNLFIGVQTSLEKGYKHRPRLAVRARRWLHPTVHGVCRLAFLFTWLSGLVLLFATMFLRHPPIAIIAVTSTVLCLASILGIYCWACNMGALRIMTSWLPIIKRGQPQKFRWSPVFALMLYTISQALAGAASARYADRESIQNVIVWLTEVSAIYLLPILLQVSSNWICIQPELNPPRTPLHYHSDQPA